ncbi:HD domain-containing protein [Sporosarcina sp. Te-1]|uniref:HD domain-containing protein n=1 Tax=Sporosarcina sp. Te-1 TaxID=2818390 RepID=UPI001A9D5B6E|nr:HD domain-containing protein [Sporosarcina sp. Te-1]QTD39700.1 HD domain-containing protein [Sporosarcina sp. Te-1]
MDYIRNRNEASALLEWGKNQNPGSWYAHSIHVAQATEKVVAALISKGYDLDVDVAYNAALLHDIGRYKGFTKSVIHSYDGYEYMNQLGYRGNAQICVTHSFPSGNQHLEYAADWALVPDSMEMKLKKILNNYPAYNLYDKVIALCDALADEEGFTLLEKRLISVGLRHGTNRHTSLHWQGFYAIKNELEAMIGVSIYTLFPGIEQSIYTS